MADENPMGRGAAVALDLPAEQVRFLRGTFESARSGVRDELAGIWTSSMIQTALAARMSLTAAS